MLLASPASAAIGADAVIPALYKKCANLNKKYPHGLGRVGARDHTSGTFIAAGVNAKALSTYLGHSSIQITLDCYGHLMPGNEDEAVGLVDSYITRVTGAQTGASRAETAS